MEFLFLSTLKRRMRSVFFWCMRKWHISLSLSVGFLVFLFVFTEIVFAVKEEHVYIFPIQAEVAGWQSPEQAFQQDLSSSAAREDFTNTNSAFLDTGISSVVDPVNASSTEGILNEEIPATVPSSDSSNPPPEEPENVPVPESPLVPEVPADALSPAFFFIPKVHAQEFLASSSPEAPSTRCQILGTPCQTMTLSGFSLVEHLIRHFCSRPPSHFLLGDSA